MKILTKGNYYGSMKSEIDFNGIIFSEYNYIMPKTDWHLHENPYLMYVLKGYLYDINKKQKTPCSSGTLLFHNWQDPHCNFTESTEARGFHIEFDKNWFKEKQININLWEGSQKIENPKLHHLLAKLYSEFKYKDEYSEVSIELLLLQLCENIESIQPTKNNNEPLWINSLKEILHQNSENLSLEYLSSQLGLHPVHLSRVIPKYFSTTLGDYSRQIKIKNAINFMVSSKKSLTDISYECGFYDQSHFTRTFKSYMGMTPRQFRNKCD